ncbi:HMCN [Mytilus coruscus]|uniref:HMCN n=1 Tax=Mytilus coruscus TaxID=42192 RepID=A0A6J8ETV4_MYTCO|nr:HMCN [Mytilus coruscus]
MDRNKIFRLHVVTWIQIKNGNWGEWSIWNTCSPSCGLGYQTRRRQCNSPIPSAGGRDCNGLNSQWQRCKLAVCPVDGDWSEWSSWNTCSATCNGGIQERTRGCDNPTPSDGGRYCHGRSIESRLCNTIYSEIHGQWGSWQEWESCNATSGIRLKRRSRDCDSPFPMCDGSECIGLDFYIQNCSQDKCLGAERAIKPSKQFSTGLLVAVAVGCSVVTAVVIIFGLFVFRRLNPNQTGLQTQEECLKCVGESHDDLCLENKVFECWFASCNKENESQFFSLSQ